MSPEARSDAQPPLTRLQQQEGQVIVLVFVVWFPIYLVWVRPVFYQWVPDLDSYPAELHVVPALAVPILAALVYGKLMRWRRRDPK